MGNTELSVSNALGINLHRGWTDVSCTRSMEQFAATYEVGFIDHWADDQQAIPIREGDECGLYLDGSLVITGYVDDADVMQSATDFGMHVAGRSKAGDLVDCSAIYGKGSWKNVSLQVIANNLVQPFGLNVVVDPSASIGEPFNVFAIQDGETVYETLERGCRARGVLLVSDADGTVRFTTVGTKTTATTIFRGTDGARVGNVIVGSRAGSWRERFSQYTLKSQSVGTQSYNGKAVAQQKYVISDSAVTRYRPLVIKAEKGFGTASKLQTRAVWERNVRAGRAQRLHYTLDGWKNAEGLWQPNTLVHVKDSVLEVDTTLLVVSVTQRKSVEDGMNTDLELCDPRALTVEPLTTQKAHKRGASYYVTGSAPGGSPDTSGSVGDD